MKFISKITFAFLPAAGLLALFPDPHATQYRVERPFPQLDGYTHVTMITAEDTSLFSVKCGIVNNTKNGMTTMSPTTLVLVIPEK